jgi:hypothetical protein
VFIQKRLSCPIVRLLQQEDLCAAIG